MINLYYHIRTRDKEDMVLLGGNDKSMLKKKVQKGTILPADIETVDSATQKLAEILVQHIDDKADESLEKTSKQ